MRNRTVISKAAAALVALVVTITIGACSGTPHVRSITLTFIRHAESAANAASMCNTDIPGPSLTEEGQGQAEQLAHQLSRNNFDAVYASDMVRTQETAAPLAHALGKRVEILPGLREIDAGWYNNTPTKDADTTYLVAPMDWLNGDRKDAIPGSISGNDFNDQFTAAVQKIYDSGATKPVAFSHERVDHVLDVDEREKPQGQPGDEPSPVQRRPRGGHRQPGDGMDVGGLGRHPRLQLLSPNNSDGTVLDSTAVTVLS